MGNRKGKRRCGDGLFFFFATFGFIVRKAVVFGLDLILFVELFFEIVIEVIVEIVFIKVIKRIVVFTVAGRRLVILVRRVLFIFAIRVAGVFVFFLRIFFFCRSRGDLDFERNTIGCNSRSNGRLRCNVSYSFIGNPIPMR